LRPNLNIKVVQIGQRNLYGNFFSVGVMLQYGALPTNCPDPGPERRPPKIDRTLRTCLRPALNECDLLTGCYQSRFLGTELTGTKHSHLT